MNKLMNRAFETSDAASLAVFRIMLGLLMMKDVPIIQYSVLFNASNFRASFYGFDWVPYNITFITICAYLLPLGVLFVTVGLLYRIAMPVVTFILAYFFIISPAYYLNHYYMLILFCALMSIMSANRMWALDPILLKNMKSDQRVENWCYWILKLQTEVILIYAGLVKINSDWLSLQPLSTWLTPELYKTPIIGWLFFFDSTVAIGAYGVILLHVVGAPLLLWRKTRPWVFGLYVCFHLTNSFVFNIGIFPYMTIACTLLFFNPDWPRRLVSRTPVQKTEPEQIATDIKKQRPALIGFLLLWSGFQILNPLPVMFTSNLKTAWTGHRHFFTWRMMLNDKRIYSVAYVAYMPELNKIVFTPIEEHLSRRQCYRITGIPNMAIQFSHYLRDYYQQKYNVNDIRIHTYTMMSINFREPELWTSPTTDLTTKRPIYGVHNWLNTPTKPLRTWDEYMDSPKYVQPTYTDVLETMGLPSDAEIIFDKPNAGPNSHIELPVCPYQIEDNRKLMPSG